MTINDELSTGVLGLGWSLPRRAVFRGTAGLYAPQRGPFWLADGGVYELVQIGVDGDDVLFRTEPYEFWDVRYTPASERWTVTKCSSS